MSRPLSLIGAPSSAGAYAPGQEKAPLAFRRHGLAETLRRAGREVTDRGDAAGFRWRPDTVQPKAMNSDAVVKAAKAVAAKVGEAMEAGDAALILGGDCTIELGTVAGALDDSSSVGLLYIDLDVDLNTPETSDGALDWTGVAHLLDLPGAVAELAALGPRRPLLAPDAILFFAADAITPPEARVIAERTLPVMRLEEVKAGPVAAAVRAADWGRRFDRLLVHLDVDVLDFTDFPIAENVRRVPGLTLAELQASLAILTSAPNWRALTVAEVNPDHAPDEETAFRRLIALLDDALPR